MKRILATFLALVYFTVSSGMVMNMHYCMGKLRSVKVAMLAPKKCGCGKMEKKGCCKTESKLIKADDTQKVSYGDLTIQLPATSPVSPLNLLQTSFFSARHLVSAKAHAPPLLSRQDTYLQNCVFRI